MFKFNGEQMIANARMSMRMSAKNQNLFCVHCMYEDTVLLDVTDI